MPFSRTRKIGEVGGGGDADTPVDGAEGGGVAVEEVCGGAEGLREEELAAAAEELVLAGLGGGLAGGEGRGGRPLEVMLSPVKLKKVRPKSGLSPLRVLRLKGSYQWPRM